VTATFDAAPQGFDLSRLEVWLAARRAARPRRRTLTRLALIAVAVAAAVSGGAHHTRQVRTAPSTPVDGPVLLTTPTGREKHRPVARVRAPARTRPRTVAPAAAAPSAAMASTTAPPAHAPAPAPRASAAAVAAREFDLTPTPEDTR
jgi:hypothetical protein